MSENQIITHTRRNQHYIQSVYKVVYLVPIIAYLYWCNCLDKWINYPPNVALDIWMNSDNTS